MADEKKPAPIPEIVTGVIIVIIVIVFAVPRFMKWTEGSTIDNEAMKLISNLKLAASTAIKNKHRVWVTFKGTSVYTIFEDTNNNGAYDQGEPHRGIELPADVNFGVNQEPPVHNVWGNGTVSDPVDLVGGGHQFYFKTKGGISTNGAIYLIPAQDLGETNDNIRVIKFMSASGEISFMKPAPGASPPWQ
ncbi:MAG: hypothetical protein GWM98_20920 [Nitrospinaceae bacterium]|nr:hypothetical protein [Nitrospinaceae bacterium]NIR53292.1 hypothetical protein [Nitrospinaceae bacterium]NIS83690.1 hypothetical protein [Nitrospinaceae bacterium]NIT83782.1 hypothetical protein [Nitrospinaceae bacterium]NIU45988.1 hypothetical protein [Nitrospinaceae bacterium]